MSNISKGPHEATIIIKISPEILDNKNHKTKIMKETYSTVCGLLNNYHGGILKLTSSKSFTPSKLDEFVRGVEQTLIDLLGLTGLREYCQTTINELGNEIIFNVKPCDRICTVEYNLVLPTDFLVGKVLKMEPLEKIARVLKPGRAFDCAMLNNHMKKFEMESTMPKHLRESDTVQFKKVKSDKNKNKSSADRIIANNITRYIAAFANHKGGHVYIGIDDETYKVCGQIVTEGEEKKIKKRIESAVENMVWPEEHGKPELEKHWNILFFPVLDTTNKEAIPDLFVIVVAIAYCPGGVFVSHPEAYVLKNGKNERMEHSEWTKRVLHDAQMRDIVKFSTDPRNSWENVGTRKTTEGERSDFKTSKPDESRVSAVCDSSCSSIPLPISKVSPPSTESRTRCRRITHYMELFIQNGDFNKLQTFASKIIQNNKVIPNADVEVAVHFMLALGAYCRREFVEAYDELKKGSSLITSTENASEFQVQRLHLYASFFRGEGECDRSYKLTYDALQQTEGISSKWHTAWVFNDAANVLSILAGKKGMRKFAALLDCRLFHCIRRPLITL